jgi:ABC-type nitrate/sulfonate/bicarbonate transport system substrate-binding protein
MRWRRSECRKLPHMKRWTWLTLAFSAFLAGCGGSGAPASTSPVAPSGSVAGTSPAAAQASSPATASVKPSASAAATAKPSAAAAASIAPAKPGQLLVAYSEAIPGHAPLWAAKEGGYFDRNGLDVDPRLIESSLSVGALLSGQVQLAQVGGSEALAAAVEGGDLKVLATMAPTYAFKLEVASDIKTAQDLRGKKVGVSRVGSSSDTVTRIGLRKLGLDPDKDVSIVQVGSNQARTAAMFSGAIQASMTLPPDNLNMEDRGFHVLIDMADSGVPTNDNTLVAQGAWLAGHKAEAQKYVDSIVQVIARLKKDKQFAFDVYKKYLKLDDQRLLEAAYDSSVVQVTPPLPFPKPEQFADSVETLAQKNPKAKTFDLKAFIEPSLVQSAADRGLDKS